jgi:hypothetical protein
MNLLLFAKVKGKCHAGSILFVIQHSARLEQDYHENAVAQASSLPADRMSALHFHRDGCPNVHGHSSGMTSKYGARIVSNY